MMMLGLVNMILLLLSFCYGLCKKDAAMDQASAPDLAAEAAEGEKG